MPPFISLSTRADYHTQIDAGNIVTGEVGDGGQTNHITVTDHGELFLEPGGSAYNTQITADGDLQVDGYAENTYVDSGGQVYETRDHCDHTAGL